MEVNKIEYAGLVLLDLTQDTIKASDLKKGVKAHDKTGTVITGTMNSIPGYTFALSKKNDYFGIGYNYIDGVMEVIIDPEEQQKIIPENIKKDVSILGVTGTLDASESQELETLWTNPSPTKAFSAQTLEMDLSNYAGIIIAFKASASYAVSSNYPLSYWFFPIPSDGSQYSRRITCGWVNGTYSKANRMVRVSKTGVVFETGRTDTTNNGIYAVPTEIQVVK